jgi:hypothetical protein
MVVDTLKMQFALPKDKVKEVTALARRALKFLDFAREVSLRELAHLLGKLNALERAVFPTRLMTRNLGLNGTGGQSLHERRK